MAHVVGGKKTAVYLLLALLAFSLSNAFIEFKHPALASPSTLLLTPTDDTFVDPRFPSGPSFGGFSYLNYTVTNTNQTYIFLKFDTSSLPPSRQITNATLNMTLLAGNSFPGYQPRPDGQVGAFNASSSWSESTLNYTNPVLSTIFPNPVAVRAVVVPGVYSWNVTSIIKSAIGNVRTTIVIHHNGTLATVIKPYPLLLFGSKDGNPGQAPLLVVTYNKKPSSLNTVLFPSPDSVFGSPVIVNATITSPTPPPQTPPISIQYSTDNHTWSTVGSPLPPDVYGSVVALWMPPVATTYFVRSTWPGDFLTQNATSPSMKLTVVPASTVTSIVVSPSATGYGNQTLLIATLRPQLSEGIMRVEDSTDSGVNWAQLFSVTPINGIAFQSFNPPSTGTYLFRATWLGNNNYNASSSAVAQLVVTKAPTTLTFSVSQTILDVHSSNLVSGFLKATGGAAISGAKVVIQISPSSTSSSSVAFTDLETITTGIDGSFAFPWIPQTNGTYQVRAYFAGNPNYDTSTSRVLVVLVGVPVFPTVGQIGLLSGLLGFFIGLGLSFLVRFRRSVGVKRRQRYGGTRTKGEQPQ